MAKDEVKIAPRKKRPVIHEANIDGIEYWDAKYSCQFLSVSRETLDKYIKDGQLQVWEIKFVGNKYWIKAEEVKTVKAERERPRLKPRPGQPGWK